MKDAGYEEYTNSRANLWSDEQKPHKRLFMRVRLHNKSKPNNYTESCVVNVADIWRGKKCVVPREVCIERSERSNPYLYHSEDLGKQLGQRYRFSARLYGYITKKD